VETSNFKSTTLQVPGFFKTFCYLLQPFAGPGVREQGNGPAYSESGIYMWGSNCAVLMQRRDCVTYQATN